MWTGGQLVLGYDAVDKRLVVNEEEACQIRQVFQLYLERGSLLAAMEELERQGIRRKRWTTRRGKESGGNAFNKNSLCALLTNPLYRGKVRYGEELHDGVHEAIIDEADWHEDEDAH